MNDANDFLMPDQAPEPPPEEKRYTNGNGRGHAASDITLDAGLPADVNAEKTILGAVMLDQNALKEILFTIEADDFSLDSHRRICLRMGELWNDGTAIDIVTLAHCLARHKEIEAVGGVAYLASLTEGLPRRPQINDYLRIVRDKSMLRRMMLICSATIAQCADQSTTSATIYEQLQHNLTGVRDGLRVLLTADRTTPFFVGYQSFIESAPPQVEWTVEGLIQREGNGLILGDSGASKSLMVFDLALHMVAGVSWFQHRIPHRVKVGLVSREDAPGLSMQRLKRLVAGAPESLRMFIDVTNLEEELYVNTRMQRETWTLQSDADIQDIVESVKQRGIQFIFCDVFRALWEGNENDNQETKRVLDAATRISREANCQVAIVHHLSKSDKGTVFDRARGGGINGWKEWGIGLTVENPEADPKNQVRKLHFHTKADCAASPIFYRIDGDEGRVWLEQVDEPSKPYVPFEKKGDKKKKKQQDLNYEENHD